MNRLIDLIVEAARSLNAEYQPVQLCNIRKKVINLDKEHRYKESSYYAELNFHTINYKDKFIYIKFFAIRDENKKYLGTLKAAMEITDIKNLNGEKRLLDEGN